MYDRDGVEVSQTIGHISENAGLVRERDVGVCLHAVIKVHVHVLHDETDVCLVTTIMNSHELDYVGMTKATVELTLSSKTPLLCCASTALVLLFRPVYRGGAWEDH